MRAKHADLCHLNGAKKKVKSFEDVHGDFRAYIEGEDHSIGKALVSTRVFFCVYVALTN